MSSTDEVLQALQAHPVPAWFEDAKLGIFVHWTLASVPAWAPRTAPLPQLLRERYDDLQAWSPYAEWYSNALRLPGSPTARHHAEVHGGAPYERFREPFEAMLRGWDPKPWAELFAAAGARYVVLVTKHHEGYCLWPSAVPHPRRPGWQAPRDVVGDLAAAVRARGMRFGVYYSGGLDWSVEPRPIRALADVLAAVPQERAYARLVDAHYRELIERVEPSVLWNDIAYPPPADALWRLLADYYERVPDGVANDRFLPVGWAARALRWRPIGALAHEIARHLVVRSDSLFVPPPPPVYDFRTPEYASFAEPTRGKWEATRGIGLSFGHNRNEPDEDLIDPDELVCGFIDAVAKNGNLLLNVGPTAEGAIQPREQLRLEALGAWLRANGEAIYGTRPWRDAAARDLQGHEWRFTTRRGTVYAIVLDSPRPGPLRIPRLATGAGGRLRRLGGEELACRVDGKDVVCEWPAGVAASPAHVLVWDIPPVRGGRAAGGGGAPRS